MEIYHQVWLDNHPEYDGAWLQQAIDAGFDVHHVDEDHSNNEPDNLVLIERSDHMRLHRGGAPVRDVHTWEESKERVKLGQEAYRLRKEGGDTWKAIGVQLGYEDNPATSALGVAARYASYHKMQWPVPHKEGCRCSWCAGRR